MAARISNCTSSTTNGPSTALTNDCLPLQTPNNSSRPPHPKVEALVLCQVTRPPVPSRSPRAKLRYAQTVSELVNTPTTFQMITGRDRMSRP